jgi:organic radical activating enzyme
MQQSKAISKEIVPSGLPPGNYPVMEHFYTIQGEGMHTGKAAYFIRLAGCDVGCVWCDVKESWEADKHPIMSVDELVKSCKKHGASNVVITGGEPTMHPLADLTAALREHGMQVWLETSGAHPISGNFDWICLSPKKYKAPLPENLKLANELKVVIFHPSDFEWAEKYAQMVVSGTKLFLQPEYSRFNKIVPLMVDYIKSHPEWQFSLQMHKVINVP